MNLSVLLCKLPRWMGGGHKRGKRVGYEIKQHEDGGTVLTGKAAYRCPRCGATWTRKLRAKPQPEREDTDKEKTNGS